MKLHEAVSLFLAEQRRTTANSYFYVLRDMQNYLGYTRPVDEIAAADLIRYIQAVRRRKHDGKPLAKATINKYVKTTRTLFNWLVKLGVLSEAPTKALKMEHIDAYITREKAITEEELQILLNVTRGKPRDRALILFLAETGCRARGACGLTMDDLDLENMTGVVTEKGDKTRRVVFGPVCRDALKRWLWVRRRKPGVYVFSNKATPISSNYLGQIIRRNCKAAQDQGDNIRIISAHAFRHRKGHQLADDHVAPSIAATALGHSDVMTTLRHYYPADWESAEQALRATHIQPEPQAEPKPKNIVNLNDSLTG
ncbi:tyrosine-type recombinase/integrase [Phototrophicus methaneseepsis]|uniref:Tyrosine-type recombinase/integrase n=1 Tax=Phototrophicus methaneseepsis TaxID=2710758 RepID=A0A7S8IC08_9CHLR|nr:tyrosine-type recombinase/integrase [Phototrophicus methaneseepsis]QPC81030.1 tyrosine-type recombinase/integrase [Phototrophicus methaneseepsis]